MKSLFDFIFSCFHVYDKTLQQEFYYCDSHSTWHSLAQSAQVGSVSAIVLEEIDAVDNDHDCYGTSDSDGSGLVFSVANSSFTDKTRTMTTTAMLTRTWTKQIIKCELILKSLQTMAEVTIVGVTQFSNITVITSRLDPSVRHLIKTTHTGILLAPIPVSMVTHHVHIQQQLRLL